jgi:DNA-binding IclR family transcriptional regulator
MKAKSDGLSSTEKALKILMSFTPHNHEMGTLELSKKLGIHKSTVSRLLHLLKDNDFLEQNPDTKKYILGRSAAEIGNAAVKSLNTNIVGLAQPHLNALSAMVGESVALEVLSGTQVVLAHQVEGQQHIRFSFTLGEHTPLHVTAGAKAILAFSEPEFVGRCLKKKFTRFTPYTISSKKKYSEVLDEVRKTGIAFDKGERYEDVWAMGTPIFSHGGSPVAAVVIAGPAARWTSSFIELSISPLKKTAAEISERLLY